MLERRNFKNDIIVGKTSGFCYGVKNAVEKSEQELKNENEVVYCLGELVHNKTVTQELENKGLVFIEDIKEAKGKTIIRAHGVPKEVYDIAKQKKIELVDLTCPNVLKIHKIAEEYVKKGYYIFLVGKKQHPEILGTYSFCGENSTIISEIGEVETAILEFNKSKLNNILMISQTTYSVKLFNEIVNKVKDILDNNIHIEIKNTICLATEQRQKETDEISKKVELMIIVGGKNSSNTNKLYEIANKNCKDVIFAENENDIDVQYILKFKSIGIMAGASTPIEIVEKIKKLCENCKNEILL